jgi:hypothetical protein
VVCGGYYKDSKGATIANTLIHERCHPASTWKQKDFPEPVPETTSASRPASSAAITSACMAAAIGPRSVTQLAPPCVLHWWLCIISICGGAWQ